MAGGKVKGKRARDKGGKEGKGEEQGSLECNNFFEILDRVKNLYFIFYLYFGGISSVRQ